MLLGQELILGKVGMQVGISIGTKPRQFLLEFFRWLREGAAKAKYVGGGLHEKNHAIFVVQRQG
jgi:hypothetical protein